MTEIEKARKEKGWSRPDMFRALGIPVRTIEDWEAGRRIPPDWTTKLVIDAIKNYTEK